MLQGSKDRASWEDIDFARLSSLALILADLMLSIAATVVEILGTQPVRCHGAQG
ncbi:MAG TPA: hypothetical protein VJR71_15110 [Pseudolabrys sp.]|nr:hypothetical protein [Pseudolabrys sp.]